MNKIVVDKVLIMWYTLDTPIGSKKKKGGKVNENVERF